MVLSWPVCVVVADVVVGQHRQHINYYDVFLCVDVNLWIEASGSRQKTDKKSVLLLSHFLLLSLGFFLPLGIFCSLSVFSTSFRGCRCRRCRRCRRRRRRSRFHLTQVKPISGKSVTKKEKNFCHLLCQQFLYLSFKFLSQLETFLPLFPLPPLLSFLFFLFA